MNKPTQLEAVLKHGGGEEPGPEHSTAEKVDCLINRMDKFMECFASLHSTVSKNQSSNIRKFKRLENAHNSLATKVSNSTISMKDRLDSLESKLKESQSMNTKLADKVKRLEDEQICKDRLQKQVNDRNARKFINMEEEQGFTNKYLHDCSSEVKVRKLILSNVAETPNEDVSKTALDNINKIIEAAIAAKDPEANLDGLRKLHRGSIDNVYRIGKNPRGRFSRNISVTFLRYDDKEMVLKAKSDIKGDDVVKIFLSEDVSAEGRALKGQLKRIAQIAKSQGKIAKVSGNKVTINARSYHSNELALIPTDVKENLKNEKHTEDGIIFKGEKSIFSNFYPASFTFDDTVFQHVEQYYQHCKAIHHKEDQTADRILRMSNPRRIKALGDGIESNPEWLDRRMMVLYRGIKSKFEQNWHLQDELVTSQGKQLYEATMDRYFGCGISFESTHWAKRDWPGENVAGLILMKVREELLGLHPEPSSANNTLTEIAYDDTLNSSVIMDTGESCQSNKSEQAAQGNSGNTSRDADQLVRGVQNQTQTLSQSFSDNTAEQASQRKPATIRESLAGSQGSSTPHSLYQSSQSRGSNHRGRGRGRGRNSRGHNNQQRQYATKAKRQQDRLTDSDRNFLRMVTSKNGGESNNGTRTSSPKSNKNTHNLLGLNDQQIKGLALLGFNLPSNMAK